MLIYKIKATVRAFVLMAAYGWYCRRVVPALRLPVAVPVFYIQSLSRA